MYLNSIHLRDRGNLPEGFPFTLQAVDSLDKLAFEAPVTFLVGENGSGKSTILEAMAVGMRCPSLGRVDAALDDSLLPARLLANELRFSRGAKPLRRLFFRAEDAIGFTRRLQDSMQELQAQEDGYRHTLKGHALDLAMGVARGQREALESRYGRAPDNRSHGEWFLHMFRERILPKGLYLMDEPETPLSAIHQLSLLALVKDGVEAGSQFIIATHSPILMALPDADILSFDAYPIQKVAWEDVEHVSVTRAFLNNPASFLRHL